MKFFTLLTGLALLFSGAEPIHHLSFPEFRNYFVKSYRSFNIPPLQLSYAEYLQEIQPQYQLDRQTVFFEDVRAALALYGQQSLPASEQDDLDLIRYETALNLERLTLEKAWLKNRPAVVPTNHFYGIPDGEGWYRYFLQQWTGASVDPDELYLNGLSAIDTVKKHIDDIREQTGMDSAQFYHFLSDTSFYLRDEKKVQEAFEHVRQVVLTNLPRLFDINNIPALSIMRGTSAALSDAPGYYSDNTFYYNYADSPYNRREVGWLFLHEAIPGHHYQQAVTAMEQPSALQQLFHNAGFTEGWAAYAETLGKDLGVYRTPYDELGEWEWDLVRSVRVPLDVGLNYYGWDNTKALTFWKKYIPGRDDIALREINRMRSWPGQAIAYKYGSGQILRWRKLMQLQQDDRFDIREFHDKVLRNGSLPFFLVERKIFNE